MPVAVPRRSRYFGAYVSEEAAEGLKQFTYSGRDDSLVLKYITNPIYNRLVEQLPLWLAPNVITFAGLGCFGFAYLTFLYYCPRLEEVAPWWVYVVFAFAVLAAQTLDAIDGKQARRTGSSSPMGVLIDHGVDAACITLFSFMMAATVHAGSTWMAFTIWATSAVTFYWAHIEEFYTGMLVLGPLNGANEGMQIAAALGLLVACQGPLIFDHPCPFFPSRNWNEVMVVLYALAGVATVACNAANTFFAVAAARARMEAPGGKWSYPVAFTRPLPFMLVVGCGGLWARASREDVLGRSPQLFIGAHGLLFARLTAQLIVCHVTEQEYHPFGKTLAAVAVLALQLPPALLAEEGAPSREVSLLGLRFGQEEWVLLQIFTVAALSYLHFACSVLREMAAVLGVRLFTIPHPCHDAPPAQAHPRPLAASRAVRRSPRQKGESARER